MVARGLLKVACTALAVLLSLGGCAGPRTMESIVEEQARMDAAREKAELAKRERKQAEMQTQMRQVPQWALETPKLDGEGVLAVGFAESDKMHIALKRAVLDAEFGLAKQVRQELSGQERQATLDRGDRAAQSYSQLIDKLVASVPLTGAQTLEQVVKPVNGQFSAWVLMRLSYKQMAKIAQDDPAAASDARLQASFEDLERRIRERKEALAAQEERRQEMRLKELRERTEIIGGAGDSKASASGSAPSAADGTKTQ